MIYYLDTEKTPTIPCPHDGVIKKVDIAEDYLTFEFEDDIACHDSIKYIQPNATSLTIKIHLTDGFYTYKPKSYKKPWFRGTYIRIDNQQLCKMAEKEQLIYIGHHVGFQSIIIELDCETNIILSVPADHVEFHWIM